MKTDKRTAAQKFTEDMNKIINTWQGYENDFYNNIVIPEFSADPFLKPFIGTQPTFPHNLYLLLVIGPSGKLNPNDISLENLNAVWNKINVYSTKGGGQMDKGKRFEDYIANGLSDDFLQRVAKAFPKKLEHVGQENKREDFLISETYSIDAKYSDLKTDEKFKNIIKPWGSEIYSAVNKIEANIIRSMYKEGASQGQFRPTAKGQSVHRGIYKYDSKSGFDEITQADYDEYGFGKIPSLRKNILYLFNDDGYWATYCLKMVTKWAADNLDKLGFVEYSRSPDYKSYDAYDFWGFSKNQWEERKLWYGSSNE